MKISQLKEQLADLKKKETIAQTREQLLEEEKQKLLREIEDLFKDIKKADVIPSEDLHPGNLPAVVVKLQTYIDSEVAKCNLPLELS